jgi:NAD/NADP transhydrogenase beta subunit
MEDVMEDFTFDDFVDVLGALDVSDPADVLEAWEDFQAGLFVEGVSNG